MSEDTEPGDGYAGQDPTRRLEAARGRVHEAAKAEWGVTGDPNAPPLRRILRKSGARWYPLSALGILAIVDKFQGVAFQTLSPEISDGLGISRGGLAGIVALQALAASLATLPMAAYVQRRARRAAVAVATGVTWSLTTVVSGFVTSVGGMVAVLLADGASTGSVEAVHPPLLVDSYPPDARVRVLSLHRALERSGSIVAPLLVAVLSAAAGLTWRGVFVVMGMTSLAAVLFCTRLKDPGIGAWELAGVRRVVGDDQPSDSPTGFEPHNVTADLRLFEVLRRLLKITTLRRLYGAIAVVGLIFVPLGTYFSFFLDERWDLGPGQRGLFFAAAPVFMIVALILFGRWGDALYRSDPARLIRVAALLFALSALCLVASILSQSFPVMFLFFGLAGAFSVLVFVPLQTVILSLAPPAMRPHSSALVQIFTAAVGGLGGLVFLGGIDRRFGLTAALVSIAIPQLAAAAMINSAASTANTDLDRIVDEVLEEIEIAEMMAEGAKFPPLRCRGIDFSYGTTQVLFDVDFAVHQGEILALVGTNGAGKSTLLRVISGLESPSSGTVRFHGQDITFVDPRRRTQMGIIHIPGGSAIFDALTVQENLEMFSWSANPEGGSGPDKCYELLPQLAPLHARRAATLSGGEQQMLGLCQALIVRPKLLLIDELTMGLSPQTVQTFEEVIRSLSDDGAAVVIVDQSLTFALKLATRACFMEKGRILFEGASRDLASRGDLLRSVFFEGSRQ